MRYYFIISVVLLLSSLPAKVIAADDEKWGDLTATFIYDGEPPEPRRLTIDKDREFYKDPIYDPSLIVDRESKGISNVVVWLTVAPDVAAPAIHASYEKIAKQEVTVDWVKGQAEPHIALVWLPQTLLVKNSEPIGHNTTLSAPDNALISASIPTSEPWKQKLTKQQDRPYSISCSIHPWESGWLLIRDNPYMAVSDSKGKLQIKNLPVGTHTFVLWHERLGFLKDVKRDGKAEVFNRGRQTIEIKPGENQLGKFTFKPDKPAERKP